jgi:antirestriction protein ArdC
MTEQRADVYTRITDQIVAAIEAGAGKCRMPWHHDGQAPSRPINLASNKPYRGINVLVLWAAADRGGYANGLWGTYRQWLAVGAQVRKGERGTVVVLWKQTGNDNVDNQGADGDDQNTRVFARAFTVFNVAQVDGYQPDSVSLRSEPERFALADAFIANLHITTEFGSSGAYYCPRTDVVHMPNLVQFDDAADFYGVSIHEYGHATAAKSRLNRDLTGRFGSAKYAAEEVCAELISGFVLADLGIAHNPRPDHAAYIASWLAALKDDSRAIFAAASKAQTAADWMHAQQMPEMEAAA